jgi:integrase/recombinase XerD
VTQLDLLFEAYVAAQRRRRVSPLTLKATVHALRSAQRWLDEEGVAAGKLTLLECEQYFDWLLERYAVSTVRRQLAYLRAAYRYALRHELVQRDPTADVKLPWLPDVEPATYSSEQLRAIHAAIRSEREELAFFLLAFAGLRLGEAAALRWHQVDLDHEQLRLHGKAGKFRLVPLHPVLSEVVREQQLRARPGREPVIVAVNGSGLLAQTLGRTVRELVDRAGVEVAQPSHAFRRTVATVMYEQGVRTRVIERIMGWAPRQMHERHYLRVADQPMRDAIHGLYHDDPICNRQQAIAPCSAEPTGWLAEETAQLAKLERRLRMT